jgi:hypothetical protein
MSPLRGELETLYNLDRTISLEVEPAAYTVMQQDLGLEAAEVAEMLELVDAFRYDLCPEKLYRLLAQPLQYYFNPQNKHTTVALRDFYDVTGRLDGQCGDIAAILITLVRKRGLLEKINSRLAAARKPKLRIDYGTGDAPTHFIGANSQHVWAILYLENEDPLRSSKVVKLDASYKYVGVAGANSPYFMRTVVRVGDKLEVTRDQNINIGKLWLNSKQRFEVDVETQTLGISGDSSVAFSFGICWFEDRTVPVVEVIFTDGESRHYFISPITGEVTFTPPYTPHELTRVAEAELMAMLDVGKDLRFAENPLAEYPEEALHVTEF